jgi:hypothetical protein
LEHVRLESVEGHTHEHGSAGSITIILSALGSANVSMLLIPPRQRRKPGGRDSSGIKSIVTVARGG